MEPQKTINFSAPLFLRKCEAKRKIYTKADFERSINNRSKLLLPLQHDSEWQSAAIAELLADIDRKNREQVSFQCSALSPLGGSPGCFIPKAVADKARQENRLDILSEFPELHHECYIVDYVRAQGVDFDLVSDSDIEDTAFPTLEIQLYTFFGIGDLTQMFDYDSLMLADIRELLTRRLITYDKRLKAQGYSGVVRVPWKASIVDTDSITHYYKVRLSFVDISAIQGVASFKEILAALGLDTGDKELLSEQDKGRMLSVLFERPQDFKAYALGDLRINDTLEKHNSLLQSIYNMLGLKEYAEETKLTIGSTVHNLLRSAAIDWTKPEYSTQKELREFIDTFFGSASAGQISVKNDASMKPLCAKVIGGRARNNNPLFRHDYGAYGDIDIAGAYATSMLSFTLPFGKPIFLDFFDKQVRPTIKDFLRKFKNELIDGLWFLVVSTPKGYQLKFPQDFIPSYIEHKIRKRKNNGEYIQYLDVGEGRTKYYKHEIHHGVITCDTVCWIMESNRCKESREELLNLRVETAMLYRKSDRLETVEAVKQAQHDPSSKARTIWEYGKGNGKHSVQTVPYCPAWTDINIGDLFLNDIVALRKKYKDSFKKTGDLHDIALQTFLKLIANTTYGVLCSRHFPLSNTCVANNITQRVRYVMWLMEKSCDMLGAITDGCIFNLETILKPKGKRKVPIEQLPNLYRYNKRELNHKFNWQRKPIGGFTSVKPIWEHNDEGVLVHLLEVERYGQKSILTADEVADLVKNHIIALFPSSKPVMSLFSLEFKGFYNEVVYHSTANYLLINPHERREAMRGYDRGFYQGIDMDENENLIPTDEYEKNNPASIMLEKLRGNGLVKLLGPCIKEGILKSGRYAESNYLEGSKYHGASKLLPGDPHLKMIMLNYCSLSQYTFLNREQADAWYKAESRLKRRYGLTFEIFFMSNSCLNYDKMIVTLAHMVLSGVIDPIKYLDPSRHIQRGKFMEKILHRNKVKTIAAERNKQLTFTEISLDEEYDEVEDIAW